MTTPPKIGVIGAGTMGAGIAQLAAQTGARTLLHDPAPEALSRGLDGLTSTFEKLVARGKLTSDVAREIRARIDPAPVLDELAPCEIVIEAAPERLEVKTKLFGDLAAIVAEDCVLATNTSSLSVTEIAAATPVPERVVGLHFFNPAPVMRLVEVVAGELTGPRALAMARKLGEDMGKRVIDARDIAGFLVNRINRPYSLEALRLLQDGVATVEQIDRIARLGGGFRMGPFELMDLIGIDTNHAVAESFLRASYGEPRYRPSSLAARKIAAGMLGRKTGRGWYVYDEASHVPAHDLVPERGDGGGRSIAVVGSSALADQLREAALGVGYALLDVEEPWLTLICGDQRALGPRAVLVSASSLHLYDPRAAGFHALAPFESSRLVELTHTPRTDQQSMERTEQFFRSLGKATEHVRDTPGLVLGRIVSQLINEAAFVIDEGNGAPHDVDAGLELGVNHPRGPVAWSNAIGLNEVLGTLDALHLELGDDRYRACPRIRRHVAVGSSL